MKQKIVSTPPTYFLACVIGTGLLRFLVPQMNWIHFPFALFGVLFLGVGAYLVGGAYRLLTRHATPVTFAPSTCIIQEGLYRRSRNPMYVGFVILQAGLSILSGNILALLWPVLFFLVIARMFIPYEEEKMEKSFGRDYLQYKQKVRRWL
jgi:protein-S-isoprenylcysteine O-methyltransferase Ste14